jgi:hypothetical protein
MNLDDTLELVKILHKRMNGYRIGRNGIVVSKGRDILEILSLAVDWQGEKINLSRDS